MPDAQTSTDAEISEFIEALSHIERITEAQDIHVELIQPGNQSINKEDFLKEVRAAKPELFIQIAINYKQPDIYYLSAFRALRNAIVIDKAMGIPYTVIDSDHLCSVFRFPVGKFLAADLNKSAVNMNALDSQKLEQYDEPKIFAELTKDLNSQGRAKQKHR